MTKIGVFDSGVGGLTVVHAIQEMLPEADIIYIGDTLHHPYGEKSQSALIEYSRRLTEFLEKQGCHFIVVACHSASCVVTPTLQKHYPHLTFCDVIAPTLQAILTQPEGTHIGIIGTKTTMRYNPYEDAIHQAHKHYTVHSKATPLLAPLIEEGFATHPFLMTLLEHYLKDWPKPDALVLGCTHYPIIIPAIHEYYGRFIELIDPGKEIAKHIIQAYHQAIKVEKYSPNSTLKIYLTDSSPVFQAMSEHFCQSQAELLPA